MCHRVHLLVLGVVLLSAAPGLAQGEDSPKEVEATEVTADSDTPETTTTAPAAEPATVVESDGRSPIDGVVGHLGLGYFTSTAPVGVRYWFNRRSAFDIGVDAAYSNGNATAQRYGLELGYVLALAHYHYSVVFTRLGMGFRYLSASADTHPRAHYDLTGSAFIGAELFLGAFGFPNVSLQGGYGLEADWTFRGGSTFLISTANGGLSVVGASAVGFHIYL